MSPSHLKWKLRRSRGFFKYSLICLPSSFLSCSKPKWRRKSIVGDRWWRTRVRPPHQRIRANPGSKRVPTSVMKKNSVTDANSDAALRCSAQLSSAFRFLDFSLTCSKYPGSSLTSISAPFSFFFKCSGEALI